VIAAPFRLNRYRRTKTGWHYYDVLAFAYGSYRLVWRIALRVDAPAPPAKDRG
jgi:hypothetical protein